MARVRRLIPRPIHQIVAQAPDEWRSDGSDPQFRLDGPFARGLWEMTFTGAAPVGADYDAVRVYYWREDGLSETASIRFPGIGTRRSRRTLRFWLPQDTPWLRLDPTEAAGLVHFSAIEAVRRSPVVAVMRGTLEHLRRAPLQTIDRIQRVLSTARRDRHERNRLLLAFALPDADDGYERWLERRVVDRLSEYPADGEDGLFSLLTTVFDTSALYIDTLAASVFGQTWTGFEWVILDNGSQAPATRAALERLARDPRVRLFRTDRNLGIIGGMRYVLERASHRYILPVDSDDYLFPDALSIIASLVQRHDSPPLLYSDEDKLRERRHTDPFFKPDWDPVLLRNCCYIAHLCAIDRKQAIHLGAYTDPAAEGCHDWDTFLRFMRAGMAAIHVPEILYSWRMHAASTAADVSAKHYIVNSHRHVLENHVALSGLGDRVEVVASPFFPASPDWWFRRTRVNPPPVELIVYLPDPDLPVSPLPALGGYPVERIWLVERSTDGRLGTVAVREARALYPEAIVERVSGQPGETLARAARTAAPLVAVIDTGICSAGDEWLWEMIGLKESFPDVVMLGGRLIDDGGRVLRAAGIFGLGEGVDSPDQGRAERDPGYFGTALKQRSTDIVSGFLCGYDPAFLRTVPVDAVATLDAVAVVVATQARDRGGRVVFSPFVEGRVTRAHRFSPPPGDTSLVPPNDRHYHRLLSREAGHLFRPRT
ncbi:MAG TPA: glycosyltransferase [Vicinamibacterales bacterium]|nr:glycosyltransferase [Vicinamibacterales bacterium]